MTSSQPKGGAPDELSGALLARLRRAAGRMSQKRAEQLSGVSQAQISRMEGTSRTPGEPPYPLRYTDVRRLLETYAAVENWNTDVDPSGLTEQRLTALLEQARPDTERLDTRVMLQRGRSHNLQLRVFSAERHADEVHCYEPASPFGVMQTAEYMAVTFTPERGYSKQDAEASTNVRTERSRILVDEPHRRWYLIQNEAALRWPVRSYGVQAGLIRRMIELSLLPNVHFGVIPLDTLAPEPAPLANFNIYDDRQVLFEAEVGLALIDEPELVEPFLNAFRMVRDLAVWNDSARSLLARIAESYEARA